jgi:hypothetical protein
MYKPPAAVCLPPLTLTAYWNVPFSSRMLALLAGLICGSRNLLQFQGGIIVDLATADLVEAYPLVFTVWDIYIYWRILQSWWQDCGVLYRCHVYDVHEWNRPTYLECRVLGEERAHAERWPFCFEWPDPVDTGTTSRIRSFPRLGCIRSTRALHTRRPRSSRRGLRLLIVCYASMQN